MRRILPRRSFVLPDERRASRAWSASGLSPASLAEPVVDRVVALRLGVLGVVAGRDVEVAVGPEGHRAGGVAADDPLVGELEQPPLRRHVERPVGRHREARHALDLGRLRAVEQVQPPVGGEVRVERDPEQAVLVAAVDRDRADPADRAGGPVVVLDRAGQLDVVDVAVGGDGDLHRVLGVVVERDLVERRVGRQALALGAAVALRLARRPLDGAADVVLVVLLLPVRAVVAERGVEVAPAVVVRAPRDRVVVVDAVAAVLLDVGALVELEQDVHVLRLGGEVVPLVLAHPVLRHVDRRGVRVVDAVDRGGLELEVAGRVVEEPGAAHHVALPGPVAVGVGVGVDAHDAAAALRPALEGVALGGAEDALAVGVEEDHDLELA